MHSRLLLLHWTYQATRHSLTMPSSHSLYYSSSLLTPLFYPASHAWTCSAGMDNLCTLNATLVLFAAHRDKASFCSSESAEIESKSDTRHVPLWNSLTLSNVHHRQSTQYPLAPGPLLTTHPILLIFALLQTLLLYFKPAAISEATTCYSVLAVDFVLVNLLQIC